MTFRGLLLRIWRGVCRMAINIFYRHYEVAGFENIPKDCGIIFCANHVNALVDPILVQAASKKTMRPLARSGLFHKLWLKPILNLMGAVPVYRSSDKDADPSKNEDSFKRVFELLEQGEWIMLFPEGQSHTYSKLTQLKTGAARMMLGTIRRGNSMPLLIPVGLTFTKKGQFRGDVLVYFGHPVDMTIPENLSDFGAVDLITQRLSDGMKEVTINADDWSEIELVSKIDRFFAIRYSKYRNRNLIQRFKVLRRIIARHQILCKKQPNLVKQLIRDLRQFETMCRNFGVKDYHLDVAYQPLVVVWYCLRLLFLFLVILPISLWALINSAIPFYLTRHITRLFAKVSDQHETAKIVLGFFWFSLFWGVQMLVVYQYTNLNIMLLYLASLIISAMIALKMRNEIVGIKHNIHAFLLFIRKRGLKEALLARRNHIEKELASLARIANRYKDKQAASDT